MKFLHGDSTISALQYPILTSQRKVKYTCFSKHNITRVHSGHIKFKNLFLLGISSKNYQKLTRYGRLQLKYVYQIS